MKARKSREDFPPSGQLRKLYLLILSAVFLILLIPVGLVSLLLGSLSLYLLVPFLLIFLAIAWWIPKFYRSIRYGLTRDEMTWKRGVWFRKEGIVPYNRITNVDIVQGPVSRMLGISSLKVQTAGYSGSTTAKSEIKLDGIEDPEDLREALMASVRGRRPVAVESYEQDDPSERMLKELVRIRKALEKGK